VCGGTYFTSKGSLQSPNYPNFYPDRKDCIWIISAPTGRQIKLNVTDFSLEGGSHCLYDYLEIRCVLPTVSFKSNFKIFKLVFVKSVLLKPYGSCSSSNNDII
jgi:hypothetical protein